MQAVQNDTIKANDNGLFAADMAGKFRKWLEANGYPVRDSGAGQFFQVRLPSGNRWLAVERGKGGSIVTPVVLREVIDTFLSGSVSAKTLALAVASGNHTQTKPTQAATTAPASNGATSKNFHVMPVGTTLVHDAPGCKSQSCASAAPTPAPVEDAQYLSDLRDDFALHAPIPFPALYASTGLPVDEEMLVHVQLRWRYADLMMKYRTTMSGE